MAVKTNERRFKQVAAHVVRVVRSLPRDDELKRAFLPPHAQHVQSWRDIVSAYPDREKIIVQLEHLDALQRSTPRVPAVIREYSQALQRALHAFNKQFVLDQWLVQLQRGRTPVVGVSRHELENLHEPLTERHDKKISAHLARLTEFDARLAANETTKRFLVPDSQMRERFAERRASPRS